MPAGEPLRSAGERSRPASSEGQSESPASPRPCARLPQLSPQAEVCPEARPPQAGRAGSRSLESALPAAGESSAAAGAGGRGVRLWVRGGGLPQARLGPRRREAAILSPSRLLVRVLSRLRNVTWEESTTRRTVAKY